MMAYMQLGVWKRPRSCAFASAPSGPRLARVGPPVSAVHRFHTDILSATLGVKTFASAKSRLAGLVQAGEASSPTCAGPERYETVTSWRARARWPLWPTREPGRCLEAPSWSMACFAPLGPREPDFFSDCVSGKVGQLSRAATALDATALNKWVPAVPKPRWARPCGRRHATARRRSSGG